MFVELYIFAFIIIAYGFFITIAIIGFGKLKRTINGSSKQGPLFVSIVISARNEAQNITECIKQIQKQNFPKNQFEIIIIDDDSEDETYKIAEQTLGNSELNYQLIKQNTHQGKKQSLKLAIQKSKGNIIISSDADVIYRHPNWLITISDYFNTYSPSMLIMPIDYQSESKLLTIFQIIENIALTGITAGYAGIKKPFMCNGANLAFTKDAYEQANGYESHRQYTSGEDIFLMEDIKKQNPNAIHYALLRELIIKTKGVSTLSSLFHQRTRWASKAKYNSNQINLFAGFIILGANLLFLALFVAILKKSVIIPYLSIFVLAKFVFDFLLLFLASDFLGKTKKIWWIIPFECVYWMYTLIVGISSLFFKPYWKGKKIR